MHTDRRLRDAVGLNKLTYFCLCTNLLCPIKKCRFMHFCFDLKREAFAVLYVKQYHYLVIQCDVVCYGYEEENR